MSTKCQAQFAQDTDNTYEVCQHCPVLLHLFIATFNSQMALITQTVLNSPILSEKFMIFQGKYMSNGILLALLGFVKILCVFFNT